MVGSFLTAAIVTTNVVNSWELYLLYRHRLAHQTNVIPEAFRADVEPEAFRKTQEYSMDKIWFSMVCQVKNVVESTASLLALPTVWYGVETVARQSGFFPAGLTRGGFTHAYLFTLFADVTSTLLELPFSYYRTFVLEERHGFNKTTKKEFVKDTVKSFFLRAAVLDPLVVGLTTGVVKVFGEKFPLYLFGAAATLTAAATYVFPALIQPLFNKFTPLPEGTLKSNVEALAKSLKFPLTKLFEVDGSRRSAHSNAYFYGFFNNKRIVLYDTLVKQLEEKQILAVLCHEFGHWKHNHTSIMFVVGMLQLLGFCYGAQVALFHQQLYTDFGFVAGDQSAVMGFQLFSVVFFEPFSTLFGYLMSCVSRKFEFQADAFAVSMGFGQELRTALYKMQDENKSSITPDWLFAALHYSHPPLVERLDALEKEIKKSE
ncbi:CAAX prenyl protease 1, putative [Bodo saltans]|uniref:CAAX prenyl protease n=1 Tax=Bodo saltans TaxID=75058 RepID=A0A0S4J5R2_BODSA|nr:CAAX prenyl protease 1, putative [Bodo saltans]|eukprot:CUG86768.1 CAAX prenyl protease 1, putative [Bodo saltans]